MLYVLALSDFGIQWYFNEWMFIHNGESRETIFQAYFAAINELIWLLLVGNICVYLGSVLADALLVSLFTPHRLDLWGSDMAVLLPLESFTTCDLTPITSPFRGNRLRFLEILDARSKDK